MGVDLSGWEVSDRRDLGFDQVLPRGARLERLATRFKFTEGPVWNRAEGCLLFSDIPANQVKRYKPGEGVSTFREPSRNSNGLTIDKQERLLACEFRRVTRTEKDGSLTAVATHYQGKRLNNPNDIVVKSDGTIYFTDPTYGCPPKEKELPYQGVYRTDPADGGLTLLVEDFEQPNGLAFSPDEKTLYVGDSSERRHVRAFTVKDDGTLGQGRLFAELHAEDPGPPDGMKVDAHGHLYVAAAGGVWVFTPTGALLGIIRVPETPANCAWGDADWKSLYITARASLYRIRLIALGISIP